METQGQECGQSGRRETSYKVGSPALLQLQSAGSSSHLGGDQGTMVGACALSILLLLPLVTCSPLLNREPGGALAGRMTGARAAGGHCVPGGTARWLRAARAPALLVVARELLGLEQASLGGPLVRREDSGEAPDSLPADGKKVPGSLGTLVEGLQGYGRKKGGFSFRFGRG